MTTDTPRTDAAMSLKQNYDLSEKDCPVYENYVHAEVCAEIERELTDAEIERLESALIECLEITSIYDSNGDYETARDNVYDIAANALKTQDNK